MMPTPALPAISLLPVNFTNPQHAERWHEIRNDDSVRVVSRTRKRIKIEEHRAWWAESAVSRTRRLYFIVTRVNNDVHPIGIARLDDRRSWTEVSLAVEVSWRRHGVGTAALRLLKAEAEKYHLPPLGAVIQAANAASLRLFITNGYVLKKKGFVQVAYPTRRKS
jgi:RimJ/RimL family protein N-acetyltransferase